MMKPTVICLTPVRNEAWILDRFLQAASLWADYIILADQHSEDSSREIALRYPKVRLIENPDPKFNEPIRQRLLIAEARKIEGPRLLITLDADEIFTPNILTSSEWQQILESAPGTAIHFRWANLRPGFKKFWYGAWFPWGYMDDGLEHNPDLLIHCTRIPMRHGSPVLVAREIEVLHFQYTAWERMRAKHRYYQQFERITFPNKSALDIFRTYHHMFAIPKDQLLPVQETWFQEYQQLGIDLTTSCPEPENWFEQESLKLFEQYGAERFRQLYIWDTRWMQHAKNGHPASVSRIKDPRSLSDRLIQLWLMKTQPVYHRKNFGKIDRMIKKLFKY